ncbi:hypothetical protein ACYOEI_25630 [Singulisphaera rosea]
MGRTNADSGGIVGFGSRGESVRTKNWFLAMVVVTSLSVGLAVASLVGSMNKSPQTISPPPAIPRALEPLAWTPPSAPVAWTPPSALTPVPAIDPNEPIRSANIELITARRIRILGRDGSFIEIGEDSKGLLGITIGDDSSAYSHAKLFMGKDGMPSLVMSDGESSSGFVSIGITKEGSSLELDEKSGNRALIASTNAGTHVILGKPKGNSAVLTADDPSVVLMGKDGQRKKIDLGQ